MTTYKGVAACSYEQGRLEIGSICDKIKGERDKSFIAYSEQYKELFIWCCEGCNIDDAIMQLHRIKEHMNEKDKQKFEDGNKDRDGAYEVEGSS